MNLGMLVRLRSMTRNVASGRRGLLLRTLPLMFVLVGIKVVVDRLGWEFIDVSPLHTSIVAGAIFILGLMLSGTMSDYKESERLPTETAASLEAIYREGMYVKALHPEFNLDLLTERLGKIPSCLREDLIDGGKHSIVATEQLTDSFIEMDRLGVPPNYIARLKQEQAIIVRNLLRAGYIQRITFLPSAYTLVEIMVSLLITLLIFTRVASGPTDATLVGFISLIFIYILRLLRILDSPFRESGAGLDDVSLFQIDSLHAAMNGRLTQD